MQIPSQIYFPPEVLEALKMAASDSVKPLAIDETIKFIVRDWLITHGYLIVPPDVEWKDDLT